MFSKNEILNSTISGFIQTPYSYLLLLKEHCYGGSMKHEGIPKICVIWCKLTASNGSMPISNCGTQLGLKSETKAALVSKFSMTWNRLLDDHL